MIYYIDTHEYKQFSADISKVNFVDPRELAVGGKTLPPSTTHVRLSRVNGNYSGQYSTDNGANWAKVP